MLSALYSFDAFSAPRSAASCAVGRLSTLASAGPSPLHPAYNNLGYLQVFFNTIQQQQQNGVDGGWRGGSEGEPASNGAPVACSECKLLRQEVQQIKNCVHTIVCQLLVQNSGVNVNGQSPVLNGLPTAPSIPPVIPPRKRQAPMSTQPECPVALRPLSTCPIPSSFMPQWPWLFPPVVRPPSPTLPAPSLESLAPVAEHTDQGKWSNPSSVESNGLKTDSSTGESANIDIVGMDGSESSTSSTSTQAMITSPSVQQQFPQFLKEATQQIYPFPAKPADIAQPSFLYNLPKQLEQPSRVTAITASLPTTHGHANTTPERKHRKQQNDDYVKLIREQDLSEGRIARIPIPVSQALSIDPNFRAVSEQQIVQQIVQNKRYEDMDVRESMTQLCKKLAEKRVFGSKLMAETTVAGLNHSTFPNLPIEGIMYIQHVCKKVLGNRFSSDDDFWESLRDSMRKLAARCRRVRHAKKTKSSREEGVVLLSHAEYKRENEWPECSVAQTLQSLSLPPEKATHTVQTMPLIPERKLADSIQDAKPHSSDGKVSEVLQNLPVGLQALTNPSLTGQSVLSASRLAEHVSSAWSLLNLHKSAESLLKMEPKHDHDPSSP